MEEQADEPHRSVDTGGTNPENFTPTESRNRRMGRNHNDTRMLNKRERQGCDIPKKLQLKQSMRAGTNSITEAGRNN